MPREYVSLDVAARILGISADELKRKYQKHEIRGYQDRGTFQFDKGYIEELARQLGGGREPEVQVDSGLRPRAADSPRPKPAKEEDTDEQVEIGQEMVVEDRKSGSKSGAKSGAAAKAAGDSDVRLVVEGGEFDLQIAQDSDVKVMDDAGPAATSKSPSKRKTITPPPDGPDDSCVRLVPMPQEADSDVRIDVADVPSLPDSDINKMAQVGAAGTGDVESLLTEEIDLDAEIRKRQQAEAEKGQAKLKPKTKGPDAAPTAPFELSAEDLKGPLP